MFFSFIDVLAEQAKKIPDSKILSFINDDLEIIESITVQELLYKVKATAGFLQTKLRAGDRAVLVYPPSLDFIIAYLACLHAKIISIPVFPPINKVLTEQIQHITKDADPHLFLTNSEVLSKIKTLIKAKKIANLPFLRNLEALKKVKEFDEWNYDKIDWVATDKISFNNGPVWQPEIIKPDDIAFLQYTSGSTNNPKGVMITHENLISNAQAISKVFVSNENDIGINWLPPYHDLGLLTGVMQTIYAGDHNIHFTPEQFLKSPLMWLKAISKFKANVSGAPNFAFQLCVKSLMNTPLSTLELDLSQWRIAFCGGEHISKYTIDSFTEHFAPYGFKSTSFVPCYGMAEATLFMTSKRMGEEPTIQNFDAEQFEQHRAVLSSNNNAKAMVSCGSALAENNLKIVNPNTREVCAPHEVGEIWFNAPTVAAGYWQNSAQTQQTFHNQLANDTTQYLATGDLGFIYDDQLYIAGRLKEMIIIRGRNLYPQDIEKAIMDGCRDLSVKACAALSAQIEGEESLVILVEYAGNGTEDKVAIVINSVLSENFGVVPRQIMLISPEQLLKTISGKVRRAQSYAQGVAGKIPVLKTYNKIEEKTATMNEKPKDSSLLLLSIKQLPPNEQLLVMRGYVRNVIHQIFAEEKMPLPSDEQDLLGSGLDSLVAFKILDKIQSDLNDPTAITIENLYDKTSINKIAELICTKLAEQK